MRVIGVCVVVHAVASSACSKEPRSPAVAAEPLPAVATAVAPAPATAVPASSSPAAVPVPVPGSVASVVVPAPLAPAAAFVMPPSAIRAIAHVPPAAPVAPAVAGAGGASGKGPIAVVILMLPNDKGDAFQAAQPRTYKLSLTANSETATIEVDGQQIGNARVQHVYPQPVRPVVARPVRRELAPGAVLPDLDGRARFAPESSEVSYAHRPASLNPNGAPIID